jgi:hypothetical protein
VVVVWNSETYYQRLRETGIGSNVIQRGLHIYLKAWKNK